MSEAIRPEFLTTQEAAEFLRLSPITLAQWRCHDRGPSFVKLGHAVRYRLGDLLAWAERQTVAGE